MKVDNLRKKKTLVSVHRVNPDWCDVDGEVNDTYIQERKETTLRTREKKRKENRRHESEREIEKSVMCKYVYNVYHEREEERRNALCMCLDVERV